MQRHIIQRTTLEYVCYRCTRNSSNTLPETWRPLLLMSRYPERSPHTESASIAVAPFLMPSLPSRFIRESKLRAQGRAPSSDLEENERQYLPCPLRISKNVKETRDRRLGSRTGHFFRLESVKTSELRLASPAPEKPTKEESRSTPKRPLSVLERFLELYNQAPTSSPLAFHEDADSQKALLRAMLPISHWRARDLTPENTSTKGGSISSPTTPRSSVALFHELANQSSVSSPALEDEPRTTLRCDTRDSIRLEGSTSKKYVRFLQIQFEDGKPTVFYGKSRCVFPALTGYPKQGWTKDDSRESIKRPPPAMEVKARSSVEVQSAQCTRASSAA